MPDLGREVRGEVPDRVRMPLLQLITLQSLDEDYEHVAERRARSQATGADAQVATADQPARNRHRLAGVVVVVFGLMVTVAAVQTSRTAPVREASKEELIGRVDDQRKTLADLQDRVASLRSQNSSLDATLSDLTSVLAAATRQQQSLAVRTGFAATSGEGIVVTVDDNPNGDPDDEVQDRDLRALFNGLWEAGATGIAVNGHRVTAKSAPRNSGTVIRINGVSLSPPYTVTALGDNRTLWARFIATSSGAQFHDVTQTYGMPTDVHNGSDLELPAAPSAMLGLEYATRLDQKEEK